MKINSAYNSYFSTISSPSIEKQNIEKTEKSRVETIKENIKNNSYKIDIQKTAKKIAESLL